MKYSSKFGPTKPAEQAAPATKALTILDVVRSRPAPEPTGFSATPAQLAGEGRGAGSVTPTLADAQAANKARTGEFFSEPISVADVVRAASARALRESKGH